MARNKDLRDSQYGDTTHKKRGIWYFQRCAFPFRDTPPLEIERHWAQQGEQVADVEPSHQWECTGPFNVAGRVTSLVVDPRDSSTLYAGSAAGGVWKSQDQGRNWSSSWPRFGDQNIGALAARRGQKHVDHGATILYAATGEANMSADSYPGSGVFESDDGGLSWSTFFSGPKETIEQSIRTFPRRIGCLAFDRHGRVGLGCVSHVEQMPAALYLDSGGMGLQPCSFWGTRSYDCYALLFHPEHPKLIYTAIAPGGSQNGIWRSQDGGASWEHLTRGLPPGDLFRRTSLAFAPSDPDVIYAVAADSSKHVLGVFLTTNAGRSWKEILHNRYLREREMSYNNTLAVHPQKPDSMIWGGMKLYRTSNFGHTWRQITTSANSRRPNYVHSDHHAIVWPEDQLVYSANDGGVAVSEDGGNHWEERTRGMVSTTFYSLGVAPSNGKVFGGGTQDNGIVVTGVDGQPPGDFVRAISGDGSWIGFDGAEEENVFGAATDLFIYLHKKGEPWVGWRSIEPHQVAFGERTEQAFGVLAIDPSTRKGVKKLWAGTARLWSTKNNGRRWEQASPVFDSTPISSIAICSRNPRLMFAGTNGGGIFRSTDGGKTWSGDLTGIDVPRRAITSIQVHPASQRTVVATVASTGSLAKSVRTDGGQEMIYSHVFLSQDQGETWEDIDQGALPNVVYNSAAFQTHPPYNLFVACDVGVFMRSPGEWTNVSGNLPTVVISSLVYHAKDRTLTAATFGRGIWRIRGTIRPDPGGAVRRAHPVPLAEGLREDPRAPAPRVVSPAKDAKFGQYPMVPLAWTPVPEATAYQIELWVLPLKFTMWYSTREPRFDLDFHIQGSSARWRVWAVLPEGLRSPPSPWRNFRVTPG